jgi:hypothetical protein
LVRLLNLGGKNHNKAQDGGDKDRTNLWQSVRLYQMVQGDLLPVRMTVLHGLEEEKVAN